MPPAGRLFLSASPLETKGDEDEEVARSATDFLSVEPAARGGVCVEELHPLGLWVKLELWIAGTANRTPLLLRLGVGKDALAVESRPVA
jgi:hypothetical protein